MDSTFAGDGDERGRGKASAAGRELVHAVFSPSNTARRATNNLAAAIASPA